ncbi:MAG: hypothetical protein V3R45_05480, partial [Candidatus Aminicenantaceae bacterium]
MTSILSSRAQRGDLTTKIASSLLVSPTISPCFFKKYETSPIDKEFQDPYRFSWLKNLKSLYDEVRLIFS